MDPKSVKVFENRICSGCSCPYDWLKAHDGKSNEAPVIDQIFCGYKPRGKVIFSTRENIFLEFHSSKAPNSENLGFNLTFEFSDEFVNLSKLHFALRQDKETNRLCLIKSYHDTYKIFNAK